MTTNQRDHPSIIQADGEYLAAIATGGFYPGVLLFRSPDLARWEQLPHPLEQVELPESGVLRGPDLSYVDGVYHLLYSTALSAGEHGFADSPIFHVRAPSPHGPWSPPELLHAKGFHPSLYHESGRSYLLWAEWDHRPGRDSSGGTWAQEFDRGARRLTGRAHPVRGGDRGARLHRRAGWYYLVAEGIAVARSPHLTGPFHPDPHGALVAGGGPGCLVEGRAGEWWLTAWPADGCALGPETVVRAVDWAGDGWPRVGAQRPRISPTAPDPAHLVDDFDATELAFCWQSVRRPPDPGWLSLRERPGWLRLRADESPASRHRVSLLARHQHQDCEFSAVLDAQPTHFQQLAGLIHYTDHTRWHWLHLTHHERIGRCLAVLTSENGQLAAPADPLPWPSGPVWLRALIQHGELRFTASADGGTWTGIGPPLPVSRGFLGVCATDLTGARLVCDVDRMSLRPLASPR
ncbi:MULTISPECIES: family 43 glycosylhydrolase [unclassified Crossiella]|uniref:beta-xylosidase family glycoside hydrolase n=1 Tax=unclassified Crossiella TaxID=2620835 RepID=UPI001FFFDF45|nr:MULTISPECIES: family 43 glycosylhydrolase [unclassified Crossiella]MCK2244705.1 family 43 glycosylhydrolase [Crossiella sp. S99.2]MCK2258308.1 family 43 glycosylhydrolase [Crossiella sp. S99.1]